MSRKHLFATAVGILAVAVVSAYGAYRMRSPASLEPAGPTPAAKSPSKSHPPMTAVRNKVLTAFHGQASHQFTEIPGFGFGRMEPLYKKIPFEIPYFSTGDIEVVSAPEKAPKALDWALARGVAAFHGGDAKGVQPDEATIKEIGDKTPYGFAHGGAISQGLQVLLLDLVGLTDLSQPKVYSGGKAFELVNPPKDGLTNFARNQPQDVQLPFESLLQKQADQATEEPAETRSLDMFEAAGVRELLQGKDVYIRSKDRVVRMLGALRAGSDCLKCHTDANAGDLLGAFSYTFVDSHHSLAAELKPAAK